MHSAAPISVLIVDDHPVVRDGIKFLMANYPDIHVVGESRDGMEAVELVGELHPHVVLMDLMMPVMDGTTAIRLIRQRYPDVQILALTSFQERHLVQEAIQAGAMGFLYKDTEPQALVQAIRAIAAGQPSLAPQATRALMQSITQPAEPGGDLTPRERDVLALMVNGATNAEIARQMSLSLSTVGFHVGNILAKLGVSNRTEAVGLAVRYKLVDVEQ
jgi:two-component system, NarL family, response regulator LiaR